MSNADDNDVKLQRASATLLLDLEKLLTRTLWKRKSESGEHQVHRRVRDEDLGKIFAIVEPFQEDPQLLDSHLKRFIPPLVAAYLDYIHLSATPKPKKHSVPLSLAVGRILNLFCKVRGEKVIKGFFNNEPRYLEPVLNEVERSSDVPDEYGSASSSTMASWEERYVLLLWLSHLMLAPFPLASISTLQSSQQMASELEIALPPEVPGIALRVLKICIKGLQSATKERSAAANLLVRLSVRPDMQKLGLLDTLVTWCLSFFAKITEEVPDIHQCLGVLSFMSGLVSSASSEEIGPYIAAVYRACQSIITQDNLMFIRSSAVARKLVVKTLRNITTHCIQPTFAPSALDTTTVLEEVIEYLLEALADGDTPVRYASSKALSVITMKLEPDMSAEVVEAILGSLNENVYWQGSKRSLSGVNPLRWHGLTLTLSHLLYRRALSTDQLPDILNALLLALSFEQRSATGGSIGTNVRDAACFGIWAMSRRYSTKELLAVKTTSVRASQHHQNRSVPQVVAIELLVVACLDPSGNIRRGSSAALQELIGRHPNTIEEGISLVQIVDFHAVGLRERAMHEVAIKAAELHQMYWEALFQNVLGWRGTGSLDAASRLTAAFTVGLLTIGQSETEVLGMSDRISANLRALKSREVEERHGLVMSLSALVDQRYRQKRPLYHDPCDTLGVSLSRLWGLFDDALRLEDKAFMSPALRPEYTASSICKFLGSMANLSHHQAKSSNPKSLDIENIVLLFNLCLGRNEDSVKQAIPAAARDLIQLLDVISPELKVTTINGWLTLLENEASYNGLRCSGHAIALGAVYSSLGVSAVYQAEKGGVEAHESQRKIIQLLTFRCTLAVAIEARAVALQALQVLLQSTHEQHQSETLPDDIKNQISSALHTALNDYTVTERGDVGSLVRLEALTTTRTAFQTKSMRDSSLDVELHADVLRLSLEKLDKVRSRAALVLEQGGYNYFEQALANANDGTSSYAYFSAAFSILNQGTCPTVHESVLLGYVSSAGMGSESVVQNSRKALMDAVDKLPTVQDGSAHTGFSLLQLMTCLTSLLTANLDNERVLLPLLEVLAFLLDMQVLHRLVDTPFSFRTLLSLTQKSHYKSTSIPKLHLAIDVYRGLGTIPSTRADTITKVTSMLLHPFPKIRFTAAECLWVLTGEEGLKRQDWSLPGKSLRGVVEGIRESIMAS